MITTDCPMCDGDATIDDGITVLACDGCGVTVDIPTDHAIRLEAAA
jgi:hypothetical protein